MISERGSVVGAERADPKVAVIIVNWNGKNDTIECLDSVRKLDYRAVETIVVDNGSSDGSVDAIRSQFPETVVLEAGANLGTTGGRNIGTRYALDNGARFVLFLDNDAVVDSQLLLNFVAQAEKLGGAGILAAKIYYFSEPRKIWYAGAQWRSPGFRIVGKGRVDDGQYEAVTEIAYACGCALFVDRETLERVGMLDDRFFCYFEETDFCYRARAAGVTCLLVPSARVWHKVSSSSGGERSPLFYYFLHRNQLLWAERNLPFAERCRLYKTVLHTILETIRPPRISSIPPATNHFLREYIRACKRKYRSPAGKATLMGIRDYLLRRFGNCPDAIRSLGR